MSLVTYMRTLQDPGRGPQFGAIVVPTASPEQLDRADPASADPGARGAAVYFALGCQTCHGAVGDAPGDLALSRGGGAGGASDPSGSARHAGIQWGTTDRCRVGRPPGIPSDHRVATRAVNAAFTAGNAPCYEAAACSRRRRRRTMLGTRILVPLDGGPIGEAALPYAAAIARRTGGRLVLVRAARAAALRPGPSSRCRRG